MGNLACICYLGNFSLSVSVSVCRETSFKFEHNVLMSPMVAKKKIKKSRKEDLDINK